MKRKLCISFPSIISFLVAAVLVAKGASSGVHTTADTGPGGDEIAAPTVDTSDEVLAEKLENPIANLINFPIQNNIDLNQGPNHDGTKYTLKFQPVIPFAINKDWNIISRTILPFIEQSNVVPGRGAEAGLGDTTQSFFLSPEYAGPLGFFWGIGPAFFVPTATSTDFGSQQFGAGPTLAFGQRVGGWNFTLLTYDIWTFAGNDDAPWGLTTMIQPTISYTTPSAYTFSVNMEANYNWTGDQWTIPVNFQLSHIVHIGDQKMSIGIGARYFAVTPSTGPDWGARLTVTFLFPKDR